MSENKQSECNHDEFLNFYCGEYKCSACGQEFTVKCDGNEGRCGFCASDIQIEKTAKQAVKNTPLASCPQCHGTGRFINKLRREVNCICIGLSEPNDEIRISAVIAFRKAIQSIAKDLR